MTHTAISETLSARQQALVPIAAFAASGDIAGLNRALNAGLDAGLTVSDTREALVQLYAYAGFPRSLNALSELMKVLEERRQRGIQDSPGREPSRAIPKGDALRAAGTANQTKLAGQPVQGPVYEFAPAIREYLQTHLFGAIFERDNLDWQSRELAPISMLSSLRGADAQLGSHLRIAMNVGLTPSQLRQLVQVLDERVGPDNAQRARAALARIPLASSQAAEAPAQPKKSQTISRTGSQPPTKGPAENFTGNVRVEPLFAADQSAPYSGAYVTFEPGARSNWHTHPAGQRLLVTQGVGRTQEWGGPIVEVRAGDYVWCPPGVKHWHGASPSTGMTHVALSGTRDGKAVEWMEKVTDEQYGK